MTNRIQTRSPSVNCSWNSKRISGKGFAELGREILERPPIPQDLAGHGGELDIGGEQLIRGGEVAAADDVVEAAPGDGDRVDRSAHARLRSRAGRI